LDDVHRVDTLQIGPVPTSAATSQNDTTPNGEPFASTRPPKFLRPAEQADDEGDHTTGVRRQKKKESLANPSPLTVGSSEPPTRFLRVGQHIELPNGSVIDDYEIGAKLGAGAMGVVYSATHVKLGRSVAIKVIAPSMGSDPQALARFSREAKALASLHHPNIVDVHAFGSLPDGRSYFAMELLSGEGLDARLERGRVNLDEALDILDQMARALEAAHAQGIVHRDLKPSNTFLVRLPRERRHVVKLLDLGLVKLSVADGVERTASGAVIGTSLYISPEQARGPNVDGRTDIYALGVIAYELVLGRHPFPAARTPLAALAAHLTESPPAPKTIWPEIPPALDLLMFALLAKDANYRPTLSQVRAVIAGVRSAAESATLPRAAPSSQDRVPRAATAPVRREATDTRVWTAALVALALVIGIAIGARVMGGNADVDPSRSVSTTSAGNKQPAPTPSVPMAVDGGVSAFDATVVPAHVDVPAPNAPAPNTPAPNTPALNATKSDAGAAMKLTPLPDPAAQHAVFVAKPTTAPTTTQFKPPIERPPQHPVPRPPSKTPGRDDTINPFAEKGAKAR
jgi:serine/threonine-protein kinase